MGRTAFLVAGLRPANSVEKFILRRTSGKKRLGLRKRARPPTAGRAGLQSLTAGLRPANRIKKINFWGTPGKKKTHRFFNFGRIIFQFSRQVRPKNLVAHATKLKSYCGFVYTNRGFCFFLARPRPKKSNEPRFVYRIPQ